MRLWRISDFANLDGEGGRYTGGRWHTIGNPIVYLAEHPALALLENLVHLEIDPDDVPETYQLLEAEAPDGLAIEKQAAEDLSKRNADWRSDIAFTRTAGDDWLKGGRTALLRVPSVLLPKSTNVLLNPAHPDAGRVKIVATTRPAYDQRLFGGR